MGIVFDVRVLGEWRYPVDEGPQMIRLAQDTAATDEFSSADPTSKSVQDFVSNMAASNMAAFA
jgi:hypothetical protein